MPAASSIAIGAAVAPLAGSIISGIAGSGSSSSKQAGPISALGNQAGQALGQNLYDTQNMVNAGPGQGDVAAGASSQRDLASMLQQYQQGGAGPTSQDISQQDSLAGRLFAGQRASIRGNFAEQQQNFAQQAALQGRNPLDPVFRNKLAQEQTRQLGQLDANQSSFATQQAVNQPLQRLGFAQQRSQVLGGLASQALANRQMLASMGQSIRGGELNFAANSATAGSQSGGGLAGGIAGGLAGMGTALGALGGAGSFGAPANTGPASLGAIPKAAPGGNIFGVSSNPLG